MDRWGFDKHQAGAEDEQQKHCCGRISYPKIVERIVLLKLTWRHIVKLSIQECIAMVRIPLIFEDRTRCMI